MAIISIARAPAAPLLGPSDLREGTRIAAAWRLWSPVSPPPPTPLSVWQPWVITRHRSRVKVGPLTLIWVTGAGRWGDRLAKVKGAGSGRSARLFVSAGQVTSGQRVGSRRWGARSNTL